VIRWEVRVLLGIFMGLMMSTESYTADFSLRYGAFSVNPRFSMDTKYQQNIYLTPTATNDIVLRLSPGILCNFKHERINSSIEYILDYYHFINNKQLSGGKSNIDASIGTSYRGYGFKINELYQETLILPSGRESYVSTVNKYRYFELSKKMRKFDVILIHGDSTSWNNPDTFKYSDTSGIHNTLRFQYNMSPFTNIAVGTSYDEVNYTYDTNRSGVNISPWVSFNRVFEGQYKLDLLLGAQSRNYIGVRDWSGGVYSMSLTGPITGIGNIGISTNRSVRESLFTQENYYESMSAIIGVDRTIRNIYVGASARFTSDWYPILPERIDNVLEFGLSIGYKLRNFAPIGVNLKFTSQTSTYNRYNYDDITFGVGVTNIF